MHKTILHPQEAPRAQAVMIETTDHNRILFSSVTATTDHGTPIGKTLDDETRFALSRLGKSLAELGGVFGHIVRLTHYLTDPPTPEVHDAVHTASHEFFPDPSQYPATTLVHVDGLSHPDARIQIDAEAVIPHDDWDTTIID